MLTAIELELAAMFIILGFTGLSKKLNTMVPPAVKAGIVLGAGVNAIYARLGAGGAVDTVTIGCVGGLVIIFMLMFSRRVRKYMETNRFVAILVTTASSGAFWHCSFWAAQLVSSSSTSLAKSSVFLTSLDCSR